MFSKWTIEDKRQKILQLQAERFKLRTGARAAKTKSSSSGSRSRQTKPKFTNPEVEAIFNKMPADFQKYLQKGR